MRNAGLEGTQAGIKIPGRNINNLRYADTTLMAETEEELKSLLMRVKEESETAGSKLSIQKTLRSWHLFPSLHGKQKGEKWKQWQILFSWASKSLWTVTTAMKLRHLLLGRKAMIKLDSVLGEGNGTHSCTLAWKIPWMEEPGRLYSPWGRKESDTTELLHFHFNHN